MSIAIATESEELENISLFIPHVFPNFTEEYICGVFGKIGEVKRVDLVPKHDLYGKVKYNSVYVHFVSWYTADDKVRTFYYDVLDKEARFYHDDPWYWIVLPNTARKQSPCDRKPRLDIGDLDNKKRGREHASPSAQKAFSPSYSAVVKGNKKLTFSEENDYVEPRCEEEEAYQGVTNHVEEEQENTAYEEGDYARMEDIEAQTEQQQPELVMVDAEYIRNIEQQNMALRFEVEQLRTAVINLDRMYQAEAAKLRAFSFGAANAAVEPERK
jgi:hypothetical protein